MAPSPAGIARKWARAIATSTSVPVAAAKAEAYLLDLTERLVSALSGAAVDTRAASEVGAALVAGGFTGAQALPGTFDVLGSALPAAVAGGAAHGGAAARPPCGPIIELLGALASGHVSALRSHILDQQDGARFREVFDSSPVGIAISEPVGLIIQTNRSLQDILGYSGNELLGRYLGELFSPGDQPIVEEHYRALVDGREPRLRIRVAMRRADGETIWVYLDGAVLRDAERSPRHIIVMLEDLTNQLLLEQQLHHQSLHDPQTGLANRQYLATHLEAVLARSAPSTVITLLHLDLDGFSTINDGIGPHAGDQALDVVARRLEGVLADRPSMMARLGADEFAILIESGDPALDIGALTEAIDTELAEPFYLDDSGVALTATIGIAQRRASGCTPEELMRAASITLRRIHGRGKRQWALSDPDLDAADQARLLLAAAMPGALETGQLHVTYQPVLTLAERRLMGIEASLSWWHPDRGVLSHEECVHAAEQTGVVHDVGQWLLRTAAEQAMAWRQRIGASVPPIVVNLMSFQAGGPELVAKIRAVLAGTGLPPDRLEIRAPVAAIRTVTGELASAGGAQAEDNLRVLAELGVRIGLHNFGGGIGELRCVADLPVSTVRIAAPISKQVAEDPSRILSQAAQALVHIVRDAGVDVVAYPVDSHEQAACWPWIGANWAVGSLYGEIEDWIEV